MTTKKIISTEQSPSAIGPYSQANQFGDMIFTSGQIPLKKTTCFIKDMNDFVAFNEVYGKYFATLAPARSCVEVARLPKDVLVEVEAVAFVASK